MIMAPKRSSVEILHDILEIARSRNGEKKTRIMSDANLSYDMLKRYLGFLEGKTYLLHDPQSREYRVTPSGLHFLGDVSNVLVHLRELTADEPFDHGSPRALDPTPQPDNARRAYI